jgi:hypothetical protein
MRIRRSSKLAYFLAALLFIAISVISKYKLFDNASPNDNIHYAPAFLGQILLITGFIMFFLEFIRIIKNKNV